MTTLTETEIDEAVARKLGWKDSEFPVKKGWYKLEVQFGSWAYSTEFPPYSTQIQAAWEIVDWLTKHQPEYEFSVFRAVSWCCSIGKAGTVGQDYADTAPKAICLAFLKLP